MAEKLVAEPDATEPTVSAAPTTRELVAASDAALLRGEDRLAVALRAIDAANSGDPHTLDFAGVSEPKELLHARLMTAWVRHFDPDAGEAQLLAARAHHVRRWELARTDYPEGRAGYLRWRTDAKKFHARVVAELLGEAGYQSEEIERVGQIIRKEGLRTDPVVQVHEDALCLVFLQTQFAPTAVKLGDDKTVEVLSKTWAKMSERGRSAALGLELAAHEADLVHRALQA